MIRKLVLLACAAACGAPSAAPAQPEPSFHATCGDLRAALETLDGEDDQLVTIQIEGTLTAVESDGALVYMGLCGPPDPGVLCVTYADGGRRVGDLVVVSGNHSRYGPDHVLLDPCLHFPPD